MDDWVNLACRKVRVLGVMILNPAVGARKSLSGANILSGFDDMDSAYPSLHPSGVVHGRYQSS